MRTGSIDWSWRGWTSICSRVESIQTKRKLSEEFLALVEQELGKEHFYYFATQMQLADVLIEEKKFKEAEVIIRKCMQDTKDTPLRQDSDLGLLGLLFNSLMSQDRFQDALEVQCQASVLSVNRGDHQRLEWQYYLAEVLYRLESYNEAEKEIRACMDKWQDKIPSGRFWDVGMLRLLIDILCAQKKLSEAIDVYRQVIEILAQRDWASDAYQRSWKICLAKTLKRNGELLEAESILRGLLAQSEKDLEILPTLCEILRDQKRNTDGVELVQEYLKMSDDNPGRISVEAVVKLKLLLAKRLYVDGKLLEAEETWSQLDSLEIADLIHLANCRFRIGSQKKLEEAVKTPAKMMNMFAQGIADLVVRPLVLEESVDSRTEVILELLAHASEKGPRYARPKDESSWCVCRVPVLYAICLVRLDRVEEAKLSSQIVRQASNRLKAQFLGHHEDTISWTRTWLVDTIFADMSRIQSMEQWLEILAILKWVYSQAVELLDVGDGDTQKLEDLFSVHVDLLKNIDISGYDAESEKAGIQHLLQNATPETRNPSRVMGETSSTPDQSDRVNAREEPTNTQESQERTSSPLNQESPSTAGKSKPLSRLLSPDTWSARFHRRSRSSSPGTMSSTRIVSSSTDAKSAFDRFRRQ